MKIIIELSAADIRDYRDIKEVLTGLAQLTGAEQKRQVQVVDQFMLLVVPRNMKALLSVDP